MKKELKKRILTSIVLILLISLGLYLGPLVTMIVLFIVSYIAYSEFSYLIDKIYSREEPPKMTWWTKPEYNGLIYTAPPIPATKHFPKVFRNMPRNNPGFGFPTAKQCPAFVDLYNADWISRPIVNIN